MKRSILAVILCVAVAVVAFSVWQMSAPSPAPQVHASVKPLPKPAPAPVKPEPKPEPQVVAEAPAPPPAPEPAPAAAPALDPKWLNAETIKGTKWKDEQVEFAFLPDGRWQMFNRICAKWAVEGNRVRVYSDSGEEHFFDIHGQDLFYKGRLIGKLPVVESKPK
jgi:hypothetical protein